MTTISGATLAVGLNFSETSSNGSYEGLRRSTYATDSLTISSAYDLSDNFCALIAVQSIATGVASATFSPPISYNANGTQDEPIYSAMDNSYHIRAICATDPRDPGTQDPWDIPNNSGLINELQEAIAVYVDTNPPSENNHWNISTGINKIQH